MSTAQAEVWRDLAGVFESAAAPRLPLDEWAAKYRRVVGGPRPGPWNPANAPMSLEPMRAVSDRRVAQVTICAPAQLLKSEFCINCAVKGEYWGAPACTLRGSLPATGDSCTRAGLSSGSGSPLPALSAVFSASSGSVSRPATNA